MTPPPFARQSRRGPSPGRHPKSAGAASGKLAGVLEFGQADSQPGPHRRRRDERLAEKPPVTAMSLTKDIDGEGRRFPPPMSHVATVRVTVSAYPSSRPAR